MHAHTSPPPRSMWLVCPTFKSNSFLISYPSSRKQQQQQNKQTQQAIWSTTWLQDDRSTAWSLCWPSCQLGIFPHVTSMFWDSTTGKFPHIKPSISRGSVPQTSQSGGGLLHLCRASVIFHTRLSFHRHSQEHFPKFKSNLHWMMKASGALLLKASLPGLLKALLPPPKATAQTWETACTTPNWPRLNYSVKSS